MASFSRLDPEMIYDKSKKFYSSGRLLQVGPDSVFEFNEAFCFWDIEFAVQVKWFCEEEPLAGSYLRQDSVNPISTPIVPLINNYVAHPLSYPHC